MSTSRVVTIEMPPETVRALRERGSTLYVLHAVECARYGRPVLWYRTPVLGVTTRLAWPDALQAYLAPGQHDSPLVVPTARFDVQPGDVVEARGPDAGEVTAGGTPGCVSIYNESRVPLRAGLSGPPADGRFTPMCVLDLAPGSTAVVRPAGEVFLMISRVVAYTGTVLPRSRGPGVLVDVSGRAAPALRFGVDEGWSWDGDGARAYAPDTDLQALLIRGPA